jgi:hypothetical protein
VKGALEQLYRRNFREAAEQLAQAARLQVDPARLREVRQIFDEMKSDYWATHLFVIRDLLRKERYHEALRRVQEEQKKDLDDDLNAELNDQRVEIERRWPDQALAWSDVQLRLARTEADLICLKPRSSRWSRSLAIFRSPRPLRPASIPLFRVQPPVVGRRWSAVG